MGKERAARRRAARRPNDDRATQEAVAWVAWFRDFVGTRADEQLEDLLIAVAQGARPPQAWFDWIKSVSEHAGRPEPAAGEAVEFFMVTLVREILERDAGTTLVDGELALRATWSLATWFNAWAEPLTDSELRRALDQARLDCLLPRGFVWRAIACAVTDDEAGDELDIWTFSIEQTLASRS